MKRSICCVLLGLLLSGGGSATERLWFEGRELELQAQARACYLGFIKLYEVDYFRDPAHASCIRLSYLREIDAKTLAEATRKVFTDRHGASVSDRYDAELAQVAAAYRSVEPGDQYMYCLDTDGTGTLVRNNTSILQLPSADFARRYLQIWVREEEGPGDPRWAFRRC